MNENSKFVFLSKVNVFDENVFTRERTDEWYDHIVDSYKFVFEEFTSQLTRDTFIRFFLCGSLLEEVIVDAIIGMRKITDSEFNSIEDPNSFKIISYLAYWWMRHKPASIHYPADYSLDDVQIIRNPDMSDEEYEYCRQKMIWRLKHINELVAVQMVATYIFDFDKVICSNIECERVKQLENDNFCFADYDEMRDVVLQKLLYYFSYRTIAPKVIEHILEGYTLHPAWGLTGKQWAVARQEGVGP